MAKVMIVEDDENIRNLVQVTLEGYSYNVVAFEKAEDALGFLTTNDIDLAIFDWMLPGMDGIEAIKKLRSEKRFADLPVIILTAKDKEVDLIKGLDAGADDYLTKPFSVMELAARIRSLLRRSQKSENEHWQFTDLSIDLNTRNVLIKNESIKLTYKEFELLVYLIHNRERIVPRDELFNAIWGYDYVGESRTLDVHVNSLRKKLGEPYSQMIEATRNVGYRFIGK